MSDIVFQPEMKGTLASQMIAYMVALKFADMVPGARISNVELPAWGISHPPIDSAGPVAEEREEQRIDLVRLAAQAKAAEIGRIEWSGYGQRLENFLPVERYREVFAPPPGDPAGFGPEYLVCYLSAGEAPEGCEMDFPSTPPEFFADLVARTGLTPVFTGQTEPDAYTGRLREFFPNAMFREPQDVLMEFETIRQSRNVVVGVSVLAWLAAWLSSEVEAIFMTVNGHLNPMQMPAVNLLPYGDKRFRFTLFPVNFAAPPQQQADIHRRIAPYVRLMPQELLWRQISGAPRFARKLDDALAAFDTDYYLLTHKDVAAVGAEIGPEFGRGHFIRYGFHERRAAWRFDAAWYANTYPLAGLEVSQGDHASLVDHYAAVGKARGYRPYPAAGES